MSRLTRRLGASLLAPACAIGLVAGADTVGAQPPLESEGETAAAAFTETACAVQVPPAPGGPVRCGDVSVPLQYDDPGGETITLAVATIPATTPSGAPPLVVLGGGPGEKLVEPVLTALAAVLADPAAPPAGFVALAATRDVIFVDQRGVGLSRPALDCPEVYEVLAAGSSETLPEIAVAGYDACHDRLVADGIDLSAFNATNDAADITQVREALGYDQIDLFGTSYGARLALQVAREDAEGLAHLVLSSPVPAEENFIADVGPSYDRALWALDESCAADQACAALVPDLLGTFEDTLARLVADPAEVTIPDPATGATTTVVVDAFLFDQVVYSLFYTPDGPSLIPLVIAAAAQGDFSILASPAMSQMPTGGANSLGMQASFLCSEEAVEQSPEDADPGQTRAAQIIVADNPILGRGLADVCEVWDVPPAPQQVFEPISTDVPTLIVTSAFDQITPPAYAVSVADALPKDIFAFAAAEGHSPLLNAGACGLSVLTQFIPADWWEVDTSCLAAEPEFLTAPPAA